MFNLPSIRTFALSHAELLLREVPRQARIYRSWRTLALPNGFNCFIRSHPDNSILREFIMLYPARTKLLNPTE
jgi:hypothetical protein